MLSAAQPAHTIAQRVDRLLERQGLLGRDAENSYLAGDTADDDPMAQLLGLNCRGIPSPTELPWAQRPDARYSRYCLKT